MSKLQSVLRGALFICAIALGVVAQTAITEYAPTTPKVERITFNLGGGVVEFAENYAKARQDGTRFVIDGMCISACTMITGLIPADRVCVTQYAKLAFHSASFGAEFSGEGTRLLWHFYPEKVRELLKTKFNWDGDDATTSEHPNLMYLEGEDLLTIYQPCKENA